MRGRIELWRDTARIAADHPWMGSGPGTFGAVYPAYKTNPDQVIYDHAHNDYVQLWAETGWIGFGLAIGILGTVLGLVIAGWRARRSPWAKGLLAGVVTGIVALLIHGLNDFNFHIPSNAALFAALMGLAWNLSRPERPSVSAEPVSIRRRAAAVTGLAAVGLLLVQTATTFAADRYYRCGLEFEKAGKLDRAAEEYRRAIVWDADHPRYHFVLGRIYERLYRPGDAGALESARSEIAKAAALGPTLAEPHLHLGWIHAQRGEEEAATEEFRRVMRLDPTNNAYRQCVGRWFSAIGKPPDG